MALMLGTSHCRCFPLLGRPSSVQRSLSRIEEKGGKWYLTARGRSSTVIVILIVRLWTYPVRVHTGRFVFTVFASTHWTCRASRERNRFSGCDGSVLHARVGTGTLSTGSLSWCPKFSCSWLGLTVLAVLQSLSFTTTQ